MGERIENRLPELFQVKNITQDRAKTYADLVDFIPKNGGNLYSGRIIAENDSAGYTITLRGISARMGSNSNVAMSILAGVQSNSTPWEEENQVFHIISASRQAPQFGQTTCDYFVRRQVGDRWKQPAIINSFLSLIPTGSYYVEKPRTPTWSFSAAIAIEHQK